MSFRKIYLIIIVSFWANTWSFCQSEAVFKPYIGVGVHGGFAISEVDFLPGETDQTVSYKSITTYNSGLILNFMAESYAGIQVELNFNQRGWQEIKDSAYTYTRKMDYLEIPILTHLSFGKKRFRYVINFGPYLAFNRGFSENIEKYSANSDGPEYTDESYYGKAIDNTTDYGFLVDAGFGVNTSIGVFQIKGRYSHGITNILNSYPIGQFRYSQMINIYFGVSYYYNFHFDSKVSW